MTHSLKLSRTSEVSELLDSLGSSKLSMIEDIRLRLKKLINKKNVFFTQRCNNAIDLAMRFLVDNKYKELLIQDQGGWIHYEKLKKRFSLKEIRLETKNGLLSNKNIELIKNFEKKAILLLHSRPGYIYDEDMKKIHKSSNKNKNVVLVNDCSGSIGTNLAKFGDIIVCSFGDFKPISCGKGGLIAFDDKLLKDNLLNGNLMNDALFDYNFLSAIKKEEELALNIIDFKKLSKELSYLNKKLFFWNKISRDMKCDLIKKGFNVVNCAKNDDVCDGINVLVSFENLSETNKKVQKERLIKYLNDKKVYYTECPRYIRSNIEGISIEIKRLRFPKTIKK